MYDPFRDQKNSLFIYWQWRPMSFSIRPLKLRVWFVNVRSHNNSNSILLIIKSKLQGWKHKRAKSGEIRYAWILSRARLQHRTLESTKNKIHSFSHLHFCVCGEASKFCFDFKYWINFNYEQNVKLIVLRLGNLTD